MLASKQSGWLIYDLELTMSDSKKVDRPIGEVASKGGKAAAAKLTKEERRERARKAATARWQANLPRATHGSDDRPLRIGSIEIPCYVLDNGMRVITHRGLQGAISMAVKGSATETAAFVETIAKKGLDCKDLVARLSSPTEFVPLVGGRTAFGYEATLLADLCDFMLEARSRGGMLGKAAQRMAARCEILARGFARVGIIALVDEATGYEADRLRGELRCILEQYISKELARWERAFESDFYKHICRLKGWKYDPTSTKRTHQIARLTVDLVYDRIHPELLKELKHVREEKGKPSHKLHQWLTTFPGGGHPRLKQHNEGVTALLSVAKTWGQFSEWVDARYPKLNQTMRIPFPEDPDSEPPPAIPLSSTSPQPPSSQSPPAAPE